MARTGLTVLISLILVATLLPGAYAHHTGGQVKLLEEGDALPSFSLTDQDGKRFSSSELPRDTPILLTFVYTNCPDVCPADAAKFRQIQTTLNKDEVYLVSMSFDPNDTPEDLKSFADRFDADFTNWKFLSTHEADFLPLAHNFGLYFEEAEGPFYGHLTFTYLIQGGVVKKVYFGSIDDIRPMLGDIRALRGPNPALVMISIGIAVASVAAGVVFALRRRKKIG